MKAMHHLKRYNQICKEMDTIYHNYAKSCGLSDMAYWILYSIAESDEYFTQRHFCSDWFFAPQTVNSALKDLEKKDMIFLETSSGNRRNKLIKPTENGRKFIEQKIMPLIHAECAGFEKLSKEECESMLSVTKKYVSALREQVSVLEQECCDQTHSHTKEQEGEFL